MKAIALLVFFLGLFGTVVLPDPWWLVSAGVGFAAGAWVLGSFQNVEKDDDCGCG